MHGKEGRLAIGIELLSSKSHRLLTQNFPRLQLDSSYHRGLSSGEAVHPCFQIELVLPLVVDTDPRPVLPPRTALATNMSIKVMSPKDNLAGS